MNIKNKNYKTGFFTVIITCCAILISLSLAGCLGPELSEITLPERAGVQAAESTIIVTGSSTIKLLPDAVFINISVITENQTTTEAVNQNSIILNRLIEEIEKVDAKDLSIQNIGYDLIPLYNYFRQNQPPDIYAYRVTSAIKVKTTEIEKIGDIIVKAIENGASSVSEVGFDLTETARKTAKNNALSAAVNDANEKALAIAGSLGLRLEGISNITEIETVFPYQFMAPAGLGDLTTETVAPPIISPQEIEVYAAVKISYLFLR